MTAALIEAAPLVITMIAAAALGLLGAVLSIAVIVQRVRLGVESGDGGVPEMMQAVRAHGNFAEHAPVGLMLLALLEIGGAPIWIVAVAAVLLVAGRSLAAFGLSRSLGPSLPRQAGASATILALLLASSGLALIVLDVAS